MHILHPADAEEHFELDATSDRVSDCSSNASSAYRLVNEDLDGELNDWNGIVTDLVGQEWSGIDPGIQTKSVGA